MELRVLRYFLAVAREQSISGAAEVLHISQPTLSRQLMDMEDELGKKLFIRGNRRITLTNEGVLLRQRAEEIIGLVEKTESEITSGDEMISGDIYIGGGETEAIKIIAEIATEFKKEYPGICYQIYSGNAEDVTEKLDRGLLDFGVLIEPADIHKYEHLRLPMVDTWGVLMRKDSELAGKKEIEPQDLLNLPLICSRQMFRTQEMQKWIGRKPEKLNIVATYNLLFNASLLVEAGMGYALCLDKIIKTPDDGMLCFRPLKPSMNVHLDVVWKKNQVFSKAAELFLERLKEKL